MKKLKFFTFLLALVSGLAASAQVLVTDAAAELVDGTVIALQCRSIQGGSLYFKGADSKTSTVSTANLFTVESVEGGFKLRRLSDNKYVGKNDSNDTVEMKEQEESAITFTAASHGHGGTYTSGDQLVEGTDENLLVRFSVKDENTALNSQGTGTPKYIDGPRSFSVWYVYKYQRKIVQNAAEELTDGSVIALQCRDYNGGAGYFFKGAAAKTPELTIENLYVVKSVDNGIMLRRLSDGKYVGRNDENEVADVASAAEAVTFTAANNPTFDKSKNAEMAGTFNELYVRFSTADNVHLNTQSKAATKPAYAIGTGGYSAWYVYKYPEIEVTNPMEATLSFNRTGEDASTVSVNMNVEYDGNLSTAVGGAETKLVSCSQNFMTAGSKSTIDPAILCASVNANRTDKDPTMEFLFALTGLPENFNFDRISLHIYAFNSEGNPQDTKDGVKRLYNVSVSCGNSDTDLTKWGSKSDIDISQGIDGSNKWWDFLKEDVTDAVTIDESGVLYIKITVEKGTENKGCFFGLGGIKLDNTSNDEIEQPTLDENVVNATLACDIASELATIDAGYSAINRAFPTEIEGATYTAWPSEYNTSFSDLSSNFQLLSHAQSAIADTDNATLVTAKTNLANFIEIAANADNGYPIDFVYTPTAQYGTIYLPFDIVKPESLTFYNCTGLAEGSTTALDLTNTVASPGRNSAYIVETETENVGTNPEIYQFVGHSAQKSNNQANSDSWLHGTHTGTTAPVGSYVLQNLKGHGLGFYIVESAEADEDIPVPAGKCYLEIPSGSGAQGMKYLLFPDGTLTAIDAVDAAKPAAGATYDLSGRRVTTTTRGLYIMGGRKVLVK